ncbi:hypothetical protein A3L11_09000 [Thermococcus siculi]|uniref:PEGA domain-containing protein n=1 Tax=Thermococcus siculi TaxID=72803 RepID=A0A2Z2MLW4_9EURY|nr:PEGA domain-containing protein [Thermococcus siculi]ASJ09359.1 hypothetical protein A3L11_09000 [Thermococcus siculi]
MRKTAILIWTMFLLSTVAGAVNASPESGYGILVVDSSARVLIVEEGVNFTGPAWVELPASKEGENYTVVVDVNGLSVRIPVLVKGGLTTIVKVRGEKIEESIRTSGATPVEVWFGPPINLPPKLKGSEPELECMVTTYGPMKGRGLVFELMKNPNGDGYFLLPNGTPVEVCTGEYYLSEMYGIEDGWTSIGHYLNWTTYVPEYREIEINSYPTDSAVLVFGASYNVLRTPIKLFVPVINNVTRGYGIDMTGRRVDFRLDPIQEYNITLASNLTVAGGLAPYVDFTVNPPAEGAEIYVDFTALVQAVSLKIVYGLPPEYQGLPNGLETQSVAGQESPTNPGNQENGSLQNSTLVITTYPEDVRVELDGKTVCTGECVLNVTPGEHEVTGTAEGFAAESRKVVLAPGERLTLNLTLSPYPRFQVVSVPEGARLYIDGKPSNCTTPCNVTLTPGTHRLVFRKEGFRDYETVIRASAGDSGVISVSLTDLSGRKYSLDPRLKSGNSAGESSEEKARGGLPIPPTTVYVLAGVLAIGAGILIARKL